MKSVSRPLEIMWSNTCLEDDEDDDDDGDDDDLVENFNLFSQKAP